MNVKKVNEFFGYALFAVGALKIIFIILIVIQMASNFNAILNGGNVNSNYYSDFGIIIGSAQLLLAGGSIIMIIVNIKKQPGVIPGYLLGIGALLIEFITPSMMSVYGGFIQCGMYMKAGSKIRNQNSYNENEHEINKELIKNTEWFYSDKSEQKEKKEQIEIKKQKRMAKLEEEINEWKKLLDSGEIDELTYNEETKRLIEKEKIRSQRNKS